MEKNFSVTAENFKKVCAEINGKKIFDGYNLSSDFSTLATRELIAFLIDLSGVDSEISPYETDFINRCFSRDFSSKDIENIYLANKKFLSDADAPFTYKLISKYESDKIECGEIKEPVLSKTFFETYKVLGEELLKSDNNVKPSELMKYKSFLKDLASYSVSSFKNKADTSYFENEIAEIK